MKSALLMAGLVSAFGLPATAHAVGADQAPPYSGPKWEYRIETFLAGSVEGIPGVVASAVMSGTDAKKLEEIGQEGWELVTVTGGRAYFKRPIKEAHGWWPF